MCSKARAVVQQALARGARWLAPVEISALLRPMAFRSRPPASPATPEEAAEVARLVIGRFGGCVVKIMSRDIVHKSDLGGVALDLRTVEQVVEATQKMLERVGAEAPARPRQWRDHSPDGASAQRPRAGDGPHRRPDLRPGDRVRARRQGGRGHQRQGARLAPARPVAGAGPDRTDPRGAGLARLSRHSGRGHRRGRPASGKIVPAFGGLSGNPRTRLQSGARQFGRRGGGRRARLGRPGGGAHARRLQSALRHRALSQGAGAPHRVEKRNGGAIASGAPGRRGNVQGLLLPRLRPKTFVCAFLPR